MTFDPDDPRITAYVFDELEPDDKREFEARLEQSVELQQMVRRTRATIDSLQAGFENSEQLRLSDEHRAVVHSAVLAGPASEPVRPTVNLNSTKTGSASIHRTTWPRIAVLAGVAAVLMVSAYALFVPESNDMPSSARYTMPSHVASHSERSITADLSRDKMLGQSSAASGPPAGVSPAATEPTEYAADPFGAGADDPFAVDGDDPFAADEVPLTNPAPEQIQEVKKRRANSLENITNVEEETLMPFPDEPPLTTPDPEMWEKLSQDREKYDPISLSDSAGIADGSEPAPTADFDTLTDSITIEVPPEKWEDLGGPGSVNGFPPNLSLVVSQSQVINNETEPALGTAATGTAHEELVQGVERIIAEGNKADVAHVVELIDELKSLDGAETLEKLRTTLTSGLVDGRREDELREIIEDFRGTADHGVGPGQGGDKYDVIVENEFLRVTDLPRSTFSIDVDTASYSKVRMFLNQHQQLPRPDAVRIEELVNYFPYSYEPPTNEAEEPFAAHQAVVSCPWSPDHRLVRIGIKGKEIQQAERPASNLVFLLDVSGSMDEPNKLPLLKRGMRMLTDELSENDRVGIVVYAGAAGMVLDSTTGDRKAPIVEALDRLQAGGSTNGGEGIQLAYQMALDHFITGGTNRVILCTDGDFNVGTTGTDELVRTVEQHAKSGVFLSVLGFGMGNHNDSMLEQVSNKGNGNYAFVDTEMEARKVLVEQMSATLVTIAKDVKIQVEFNPIKVAAYRLIGYENRILAAQDFNDDTKDAGEIGAGHTVTALYEIVPAGESVDVAPAVDELKYQTPPRPTEAGDSGELLTLKLRYKQPDGDTSTLLTFPLMDSEQTFNSADRDFQFAASVASFGMLLRDSKYKGNATYDSVLEIATAAARDDKSGYRQEFLQLVRAAAELAGEPVDETDE